MTDACVTDIIARVHYILISSLPHPPNSLTIQRFSRSVIFSL